MSSGKRLFDVELLFLKCIDAESPEDAKRQMLEAISTLGTDDISRLTTVYELDQTTWERLDSEGAETREE